MPIPALEGDWLPVGRYPATVSEVEERFVKDAAFALSPTRAAVWRDWTVAVAALRKVVPVCVAWLGGSFVSTKIDPDDIDVVFTIDQRRVLAVSTDPAANQVLAVFASGSLLRQIKGWRIDTYILEWVSDPEGQRLKPGVEEYLGDRGYWDDFWQRRRTGDKNDPHVPEDALPRRGYLEVSLDGFQP